MPRHRDRMVRRAVARHIIQQVRSHRAAAGQYHDQYPGQHPAPEDATAAAAAAIAALVAGMSAARPDTCTGKYHWLCWLHESRSSLSHAVQRRAINAGGTGPRVGTPHAPQHAPHHAGSYAELELIRRIIELQREKEHLLRIVQRTS
ncbi:hypothetical protein H4R19_002802 [Coemansia spiralis]|nr:hypothetical protein H4R19_002802 [Coemansia spiralis]